MRFSLAMALGDQAYVDQQLADEKIINLIGDPSKIRSISKHFASITQSGRAGAAQTAAASLVPWNALSYRRPDIHTNFGSMLYWRTIKEQPLNSKSLRGQSSRASIERGAHNCMMEMQLKFKPNKPRQGHENASASTVVGMAYGNAFPGYYRTKSMSHRNAMTAVEVAFSLDDKFLWMEAGGRPEQLAYHLMQSMSSGSGRTM